MAANKSKRSIHLAQPQPQQAKTELQPEQAKPERPELNVNQEPTEQMPVRAHVYRAIADMNGGFENAIEGLQTLLKINYLRSDSLNEIQNQICQVRAQTNRELMAVLNEREGANAAHFNRIRVLRKATPVL
jgi:hypothetical protein